MEQRKDKPKPTFGSIMKNASIKALGGGVAGASAMVIQVSSLMWLRTMMNYQYRYGATMSQAAKALYQQGGILRFYRGITPALLQGPLSRFGDTAANVGALALLDSYDATRNLPVAVKTVAASTTSACFRICLMPIDALKTNLQVDGSLKPLLTKMKVHGPFCLFYGAIATFTANFVGHYPWFFTFNLLDSKLPKYKETGKRLARNGLVGFCASIISDSCSNSIRVIKTTRQTFAEPISYVNCVKHVVKADGVIGLFGRGLKTRIVTNGLQGLMFSILWKYFQDKLKVTKPSERKSV